MIILRWKPKNYVKGLCSEISDTVEMEPEVVRG